MAHTTIRRTAVAALAATTLLVGVTACSETNTTDPAVGLTATGAPAFEGPDGTNTSNKTPEELGREQALAKVNDFYVVLGKLDSDPAVPIEQLQTVAGGPVLDGWRADITLRRSQNVRGEGAIEVVDAKVTDAGIPVDDNGKAVSGPAWVHVRACTDISGMTWTDPQGSPAYDVNRPQFVLQTFTVRNADWPDANGWRVTSQPEKGYPPCDAS
ncbi:hypothetical protein EEB14_46915 [Rhodococcus sp. WS4]|nr:hypothetical protein EEB14_46915 [Rhodococcus sp. WS4]